MKPMKCSEKECKNRLANMENMSLNELEKYVVGCSTCGGWIFKVQEQANKTYGAISLKYAEEYMKKVSKL